MSQSEKCPNFESASGTCRIVCKLQNEPRLRGAFQMCIMMGCHPGAADFRAARCLTSDWKECSVYVKEQRGDYQ